MQHGRDTSQDATQIAERVDVAMVTYGQSTVVARALASIRDVQSDEVRLIVHVVDNNSPDGVADMIAEDFPEVDLIRSTSNDGFGRSTNRALARSQSRYVLVLNPDTELRRGVIDHLLRVMNAHDDIGMIGCRLETLDGMFDHAAKRSIPSPRQALEYVVFRSIGRPGAAYTAPDVNERALGDVDAINGAFMLVRRAAMEEVGGFDESYWMYGEDLDWCVRFTAHGWRVVYDGSVTAIHLKGSSSGRHRRLRVNWHFHRSMALFYRKHLRTGNRGIDSAVIAGVYSKFIGSAMLSAIRRGIAAINSTIGN